MSHAEFHGPETEDERRARIERKVADMARRQNVKPFDWEEVRHLTWPEEDPNDEFGKFLREIRSEGRRRA